jgi:hypothetical protein
MWNVNYEEQKASPKTRNDCHECGNNFWEYHLPSCEFGDNKSKYQF